MLITFSIVILLGNIILPIIWPDSRLDRLNYMASGALIAALYFLIMWR